MNIDKLAQKNPFKMKKDERAKHFDRIHRRADRPEPKERSPLIKALGQQIREKRQDRHLTLVQAAELLRIDHGQLSRIETGQVNPTVETLEAIAGALGLRLDILFVRPKRSGEEHTDAV